MSKLNRITPYGTVFILGVGAGWVIQGRHWDVFLTSYIPALATLLAAFYGAKYAFQFQIDKEVEAKRKLDLVNANNAIFSLMRMANKLFVYQRDVINVVRESPVRFLELRPTHDMEKEHIKLNIEELYFILNFTLGTEDGSLLGEVIIEEERYRNVIDTINKRSQLHLLEVQPLLESGNFEPGNLYSLTDIEEMLKPRIFGTLVQATENVITLVDETIISIQQTANKLTAVIKKQYPDETVISFTFPK